MATATLIAARNTINITAGTRQMQAWWRETCRSWLTASAAKYVNAPREAFGVWVIDADPDLSDALLAIWQAVPLAWTMRA